MTIRWNGLNAGLAPLFPESLEQTIGAPLPFLYEARSGLRSRQNQATLYAKGRNASGQVIDRARIVTNARPGESAHNWGMAVDFVPVINGALLWEPITHPAWAAMISAVRANPYLKTGADITLASGDRDWGHVEIANWRLLLPATAPREATQTIPTDPASGDSGVPASDVAPDTAVDAAPSSGTSFFEVDAGVAIGGAAIVGLLLLLWLRHRQARR